MSRPSAENTYQARTSPRKMRGEYYTPIDLARLIVRRLRPREDDLVVDPSCGDGSFLCAAIEEGARRVAGFDLEEAAVEGARRSAEHAFVARYERRPTEAEVRVSKADVLRQAECPIARGDGRLLVVGNPPYVEAKRLPREQKRALAERFPEAVVGAPDLCLYFLHVCLGWLRDEDRLAFVLPNKVLVNANAQALRETLLERDLLRGIWLATRAQLFPGAAVYPVVLFAGSGSGAGAAHVTRAEDQELRVSSVAKVDPAAYRSTRSKALFVPPVAPPLRGAFDTLMRAASHGRLDDVLDIRWTVSFHRARLREEYVLRERPERGAAKRFLGGGAFTGNAEVRRYDLSWAGWWMRYEEEELRERQNSVPSLGVFESPKVVICQNSRTLRAAFDAEGFVLKDTFLAGLPRRVDHPLTRCPRAMVGLLCSRAIHFFYAHVFEGGHVGGGYLHFLRSFLVDIPLGRWGDADAERVEALVRERESHGPNTSLEEAIDDRVCQALSLDLDDRDAIREWASKDANWIARDRVKAPRAVAPP